LPPLQVGDELDALGTVSAPGTVAATAARRAPDPLHGAVRFLDVLRLRRAAPPAPGGGVAGPAAAAAGGGAAEDAAGEHPVAFVSQAATLSQRDAAPASQLETALAAPQSSLARRLDTWLAQRPAGAVLVEIQAALAEPPAADADAAAAALEQVWRGHAAADSF
jgi:hypothetical protein